MPAPVWITVDGQAVAKGRPRVTKQGVTYTPAATRKYESYVRLVASQAMDGRDPMTEAVAVHVSAFLPIAKSWSKKKQQRALDGVLHPAGRPDLDNLIKAALDGVQGVVFRDDAQICELKARKLYSTRPRLEIAVTPMQAAESCGALFAGRAAG